MIEEGRKLRIASKVTDAILAAAAATTMAQSPQHFVSFGAVQSAGVAKGQEEGRRRGEADRNLNSARVSDPARNKKMKTFKEFVEEAYLYEMRKEDKVAGKQKTPLYNVKTNKKLEKTPEGKWETKTTTYKRPSAEATFGRSRPLHAHGLRNGVSGIHRGVKQADQKKPYVPTTDAKQRKAHSDFFRYHHGEVADNKRKERQDAPGFKQASQSWSSSKPETKPSARARMSAAADKLGLK
jgi:hypothetical protein